MTYEEMNNFILNYIENDITGRAIMLTGFWGSGKSYYIKNTLKSFLEEKKHKCAIVSLYGLSELFEISKAIYMELRTIGKEAKSEASNTAKVVGKIVGKTILNGLVTKIGFDIGNIDESDLQKVYESIDLTDKLVILEDIERTQIDIIELLGFINNMCENDGVKVLLVANEDELLEIEFVEHEVEEHGMKKIVSEEVYSEKASKYLKAKEKTISDTLQFQCDYYQTIDSIIDLFKNSDLRKAKDYLKNNRGNPIYGISIFNFRELIVACQKACDIFRYMESNNIVADDEFKICVTVGLVFYLQKRISNNELQFKSKTLFDTELSGQDIYPLMRFCYDYYNEQIIESSKIKKSVEEYKDYIIYIDKTGYDDKDLKVLYNLYINSEEDIKRAINNIYCRLNDISDISLSHYERIINHVFMLKYDIHLKDENIDKIVDKIIKNLKGRGAKFTGKSRLFTSTPMIESEEGKHKFEEVKKTVFESLEYSPEEDERVQFGDYSEIINKLCDPNEIRKFNPNKLMNMIHLNKIIGYISEYTPETIYSLRQILLWINYNELNEKNLKLILDFKHDIAALLLQENLKLDCIQKLQLKWTCQNIDKKLKNDND